MNIKSVGERVREVVINVLGFNTEFNDNIIRESEFKWDSLKHVEIIFALEDEFSIRFSGQEVEELNSTDAIISSIEKHLES